MAKRQKRELFVEYADSDYVKRDSIGFWRISNVPLRVVKKTS